MHTCMHTVVVGLCYVQHISRLFSDHRWAGCQWRTACYYSGALAVVRLPPAEGAIRAIIAAAARLLQQEVKRQAETR